MKALVIYESMFGNTRDIAQAIAAGLARHGDTELVEVSEAPAKVPPQVDLLVIGGPTHAFSMTRPDTRRQAEELTEHDLVSQGMGLREWIAELDEESTHAQVATFDTRLAHPRWFWGSAARAAQKRLRRLGFRTVDRAANFYVRGPGGPPEDALLVGELERARAWGETLATRAAWQGRNELQPAVTIL